MPKSDALRSSDHTLADVGEFTTFAAAFSRDLRAGDAVALSGPLGAGKTTFVRAVVAALHGCDTASSPTFTFRHRYTAPAGNAGVPIDHLDLYRVENVAELRELGLEDAFADDSIVLVEWWDRAPGLLPPRRYEIDIQGSGDGARTVKVRRPG